MRAGIVGSAAWVPFGSDLLSISRRWRAAICWARSRRSPHEAAQLCEIVIGQSPIEGIGGNVVSRVDHETASLLEIGPSDLDRG